MLDRRLQIVEYLSIAAAVVGAIAAVASGQLAYALLPIILTLLLGAINRLRLEQRLRRRLHGTVAQHQRQQQQESDTRLKRQIDESIATLEKKLLTPPTPNIPDLPSEQRHLIQLKAQIASLEQTLSSVVQYLNSSSLPVRVERLEKAIATTTAEIAQLHRQLAASPIKQPHQSEYGDSSPPESVAPDLPDFSVPISSWHQVQTLTGHSDWVRSLVFSPDGQLLASGSLDGTVKLWQLSTGTLLRTLSDHTQGVLSLAIAPDGEILASGSFDQTIVLWHLESGEVMQTLKGHTGSVRSLTIVPDGVLLSGSYDGTIKRWRLETGEFLDNLTQGSEPISAIASSPDGQTLAWGGDDGAIAIKRADSPEFRLTDNLNALASLAISPDGQLLAAGCANGTIELWKLAPVEWVNRLDTHSGPVMSAIFGEDGETLMSGSAEGAIEIWLLATGQSLGTLTPEPAIAILSVALSPDGQFVAGGTRDGTVRIWQRD